MSVQADLRLVNIVELHHKLPGLSRLREEDTHNVVDAQCRDYHPKDPLLQLRISLLYTGQTPLLSPSPIWL